jgi:hypothetical protein
MSLEPGIGAERSGRGGHRRIVRASVSGVIVVEPGVQPKLMADDAGCRIASNISRGRTAGRSRRVRVVVCIERKHEYLLDRMGLMVQAPGGGGGQRYIGVPLGGGAGNSPTRIFEKGNDDDISAARCSWEGDDRKGDGDGPHGSPLSVAQFAATAEPGVAGGALRHRHNNAPVTNAGVTRFLRYVQALSGFRPNTTAYP